MFECLIDDVLGRGETEAELHVGLGLGDLGKHEVLKTYMFDRAYQVQVKPNLTNPTIIFEEAIL